MIRKPEDLYLDLIKKTLVFSLWPEPPIALEIFNSQKPLLKRLLISFISRILRSKQLLLAHQRDVTTDQREEGRIWPGYAHTMVGLKRLDNLQFCAEAVIRDGVEGDLIETGVWRGGACILMRAILAAYGIKDRKVYVADSFEGLPRPDPEKCPVDKGDTHYIRTWLAVSRDEVEDNFRRFGLLDDQVVFLKGWFKDTLPSAPMKKLAILRLDGDMYGSTMDALTNLYPKLSEGGFCIIDDYALPRCRKAVDDFRVTNSIEAEIRVVDWTGRYWRKENE